MSVRWSTLGWVAVGAIVGFAAQVQAQDDAQKAKDARVVKTLLRLKDVDLKAKPEAKAALLRHVKAMEGTDEAIDLIEKFQLVDAAESLVRVAFEKGEASAAVNAARLLLKFNQAQPLIDALAGPDDRAAIQATNVLGQAAPEAFVERFTEMLANEERQPPVRVAAAAGLARTSAGEKLLLEKAKDGTLPAEAKITVAGALSRSTDETIRTEAAKALPLPPTADGKPLPSVAELVARTGDPVNGKVVFETKGTCAKCHMVKGQGKEVGPNLTEIGSKLARDAMVTSILDPSAGISHNFETFQAVLNDGTQATGLLVSDTEEAVSLKTAEGVIRKIPRDELEELIKLKTSLMPNDLQRALTAAELVDLVEYLVSLKKAP